MQYGNMCTVVTDFDDCAQNASRFPNTKEADRIGQPLFDYRNVMPSMTESAN